MPQSFSALYCHIIFSTRARAEMIVPAMPPALYAEMGAILRRGKCSLLSIGGIRDSVHHLLAMGRDVCVATALRDVKSLSTRWVHDHHALHGSFACQTGYAAPSVGQSGLARIRAHIDGQEQHHRTQTFKEEYLAFLERYGVEYEERYAWD